VFGATLQSELRPKKSVRPGAIWITTDQGRITQVISNLITNSCKSSPPSISISVQIGRQGDQVVISVEDEGFGISPKDMAEIYAPFFRSDRKVIRNEVGTGLGLVISKTLVELHGGEIKASSTVDVGTRMQVILPEPKFGSSSLSILSGSRSMPIPIVVGSAIIPFSGVTASFRKCW